LAVGSRWSDAIAQHLELVRSMLSRHSDDENGHGRFKKLVHEWQSNVLSAERSRLLTHARLFDEFLPNSTRPLARLHPIAGAVYIGRFSPFDYYEAEYSCAAETRIPLHVVGDGPKWQCGIALHPAPCQVVSLGSNFDDAFERGMAESASHCTSYIVDPTIRAGGKSKLNAFEAGLAGYGSSLNSSVGIGAPGGRLGSAPLVSLETLLRDRFGPVRHAHLSVLKVDIEGMEYDASVMDSVWALCQSGWLHVDQLNIEVHLPSYSTLFRVRALYDLFAGARACGLMLHHKEVNTWSPASKTCAEFAWVSFAHAKRTAAAVGSHAAEPKESD